MARLRDHSFRITYGPGDDRLREFYIPALSASVRYDRTAGFFSSAALALAAQGVARLVENGGRMRLLVGAQLDPEDLAAIEAGHSLESQVARRLLAELEHLEEELVRRRLEVLAWMIGAGTLQIKVVLPTGPDGRVLPAHLAQDYYHPKAGIFTDAWGDQVAFNGSINETLQGWQRNYEQFAVYRSWDESRPYLLQEVHRFQRLWEGKEPYWVALPIPRAVQERLLTLRPSQPIYRDPLEEEQILPPKAAEAKREYGVSSAEQRERLLFQFVRDALYFPQATYLGLATCAITPWPHQVKVAQDIIERFPERFLLADEVGLGKTIEAGLVLRQLWLSGRVKRALILAPKSVCRQWQEELYEKFVLNVPVYDGKVFTDYHGRVFAPGRENPWDEFPLIIASSQLAKRRERAEQLLNATPWDLILVDEAHHARRKDFLSHRFRPNRLLELLLGVGGRPGLKNRTQGLILMTATPMQIHPVEVWDLLKLLGLSGRWGTREENFLRYFQELRQEPEEVDWSFVLDLLQDYFETGGIWDEDFCRSAEKQLGPVMWEQIKNLPLSEKRGQILKQLSLENKKILLELARRHTPVRKYARRNTRALLRRYRELGLLKENVPRRLPELVWITMRPEEAELYRKIEEYISDFYQKYEAERKGLGFIMTVYRRRLTSSFYALEMSLKRRLDFLTGKPQTGTTSGLTDEDFEQDDLDFDVSETLEEGFLHHASQEIDYIREFVHHLKGITTESKVERLFHDLQETLTKREKVIIFTQYTDTVDYLRERLRPVYGRQLACYSGRGGERWDGTFWQQASKEEIKNAFKKGDDLKILLCTEAASEGLNLQTCGVLINYDMPWNPMRVEQRIGRLDRIGQVHEEVWIKNYFYENTVEAIVYQRLGDRIGWFQEVVGELQPILSRIGEIIQKAALSGRQAREKLLEQEINNIIEEFQDRQAGFFKLDELAAFPVVSEGLFSIPIIQAELEDLFINSTYFNHIFQVNGRIPNTYEVSWEGERILVTFEPATFDQHPQSVKLLSYGEELWEKLFSKIPEPAESSQKVGILRCAIENPIPLVTYFAIENGEPVVLETLGALRSYLAQTNVPEWSADNIEAAKKQFHGHIKAKEEELRQRSRYSENGERRALEEEARQVLLEAALLDFALKQHKGLLKGDMVQSMNQIIKNLRQHKYPFAPLLLKITVNFPYKPDEYSFYQELINRNYQSLENSFLSKKRIAEDILHKLSTSKRFNNQIYFESFSKDIKLIIYNRYN